MPKFADLLWSLIRVYLEKLVRLCIVEVETTNIRIIGTCMSNCQTKSIDETMSC